MIEHKHVIKDRVVITDSVTFTINVIHPDKEMQKSISDKRWFEGIVLAASYYELYAVNKIAKYFKSKGKSISRDRIKRFNLEHLLIFLCSHDIITDSDFTQMMELKNYRNDVVHELITKIDSAKAKKLIEHGIECWNRLNNKEV